MNKKITKELKAQILKEIDLRKEFREKRKELENMVDPISKHVRLCCEWWEKNLPNAKEIVVNMDNGTTLMLIKPTLDKCSVESYFPFGVDFTESVVINLN
jgi:hypothetical protein